MDIIINSKLLFCFPLFLQKYRDCTVKTARITLNVQAVENVLIIQQLKNGKKTCYLSWLLVYKEGVDR